MINPIMSCLPLPGEDMIVFHYCLFNPVSGQQDLLVTLLSVCLDPPDLGTLHPPLHFGIIHLKEMD